MTLLLAMTGSGSCENALPEALTTRDFGEVVVFGHLAMWWMLNYGASFPRLQAAATFHPSALASLIDQGSS